MRKKLWIIILIVISLLPSCITPPEYIYIRPDPAHLPSFEEIISKELREAIAEPLDLVTDPRTVGDILNNMNEYQQGYFLYQEYSHALEDYIDEIIAIHNNGGAIKDGTDVSIRK